MADEHQLIREVFRTSRLPDFCSERELVAQTGHEKEEWPFISVRELLDSILDFTSRTSSRAGYVSPSRGQQGNALQTLIAVPFVLDGGVGETVIEACGLMRGG